MKVYLGADHAGYALKEELQKFLLGLGHEVVDKGANNLSEEDDYPDFVIPVAEKVAQEKDSFGIVLGKSGQGEAMCANRTSGVRAMVFTGCNFDLVKLAREHNDANILSLAAGFLTLDEVKFAVEIFLSTKFSGDARHIRRLEKF